ncbi:hypothetical protein B0E41_00770 [Hydrogenophaga sp. A37]|nr:hypothetical protein B0E41_00770 [Hydrogenophaga sp. A37]
MVVEVLDDLSYAIIRAYKNHPPQGYYDWMSTTATNRIRQLATVILEDSPAKDEAETNIEKECTPGAFKYLMVAWLRPQMERKFGALPDAVAKVLSLRAS